MKKRSEEIACTVVYLQLFQWRGND